MQYFYRAHTTPEAVLEFARGWFGARGFNAGGSGDSAAFTDPRGAVKVGIEIEGGHYVRVTVGTTDVGESEIDKVAKRFLSELHATEEPGHAVRGAY
ncbi:MAG TPA: hypothetical protein VGI92_09200 [Gemmatimonadales bacterium]|jgi:hypothetical protein